MKTYLLFGLMMFVVACSPVAEDVAVEVVDQAVSDAGDEVEDLDESFDWETFKFTDVRTGDTFSVADFAGEKILIESFAVWCPTCTRQQKVFQEMKGDVVHISLDTDPNENREAIVEHLDRNGFDWLYAIVPAEVSRSLIDEFGITIVNAPSAPVVLVCEDGSSRMLPSGLKKIDEINEQVALGC